MKAIPTNFDVSSLSLDSNEVHIRDNLQVNLIGWAKFRHAIAVGTDSSVLVATSGEISDEVRSMYCELGPNHYHTICCLGDAKQTMQTSDFSTSSPPLEVHHSLMSFYHSLGSALDSLSRIIYSLIVPDAATAQTGNPPRYKRSKTDWGKVSQLSNLGGFAPIFNNPAIENARNVRNALTHGWMTIARIDNNGALLWPAEIETEREIPWPHDGHSQHSFAQNYSNWSPIPCFLASHYDTVESVMNAVFLEALNHINQFESRHQISI